MCDRERVPSISYWASPKSWSSVLEFGEELIDVFSAFVGIKSLFSLVSIGLRVNMIGVAKDRSQELPTDTSPSEADFSANEKFRFLRASI
jgi:hypothetical protein